MSKMDMLNCKCIKGDYYNDIENNMIIAYKNIDEYVNSDIKVQYDYSNNTYYFTVLTTGKAISADDRRVIKTFIPLATYINTDAIKLFAKKYTLEEYDKKFNDYSHDNYELIREGIKDTIEEARKIGIKFTTIDINESNYRISFYHPELSNKRTGWRGNHTNLSNPYDEEYCSHWFAIRPISLSTAKNSVRDINKQINRFIAKCVEKQLTK